MNILDQGKSGQGIFPDIISEEAYPLSFDRSENISITLIKGFLRDLLDAEDVAIFNA